MREDFSGVRINKVVESAPKLKPPFKVYMYEILGKRTSCRRCAIRHFLFDEDAWQTCFQLSPFGCYEGAGAVVGEFVCDEVNFFMVGSVYCDLVEKLSCSYEEMIDYFYKPEEIVRELTTKGYGNATKEGKVLNITKVKPFDELRELAEFGRYVRKQSIIHKGIETIIEDYEEYVPLTRAPRNWCYVEEIEE